MQTVPFTDRFDMWMTFFFYLKKNEIASIEEIQTETINNYHKHLQTRKNKRQSGSPVPKLYQQQHQRFETL